MRAVALRRSTVLASRREGGLARVGAEEAATPPAASGPRATVTVECADVPLRWMHAVGVVLAVVAGVWAYGRYAT